ncbi:MAG: phospho-sugar mutase [Actinomycetaceae bacterium]|nr:phospho-sugar mutase [Actinomycetaceae bacterium]MDY6082376.1 phospho-sugar mutase [Actinomycetaceae bacterium]
MFDPAAVRTWISHDVEPHYQEELTDLLQKAESGDADAAAELDDRFSGPIQFGTAGLRGTMGAGEHRMNRSVVRAAAYGLASYVKEKVGDEALIVIGNDARYHSREFALDSARIVSALGLRAMIMPRDLPTPVLAFAVRYLNADAGVMVTASHNPAHDNGYKVYLGGRMTGEWDRGSQLVPPVDAEISQRIASAPFADDIPLAEGYQTVPESVIDAYVDRCVSLVPDSVPRTLKIVYTPMHGVGQQIASRVFTGAGFTDVTTVAEQENPDPDFPTVPFPNPEEKGALDMAQALAAKIGADIVLATDPDADRCAVAVPFGSDGAFRQLTGDETGIVLGEYIASHAAELSTRDHGLDVSNHEPNASDQTMALASSLVSSRMLGRIAATHHLDFHQTLTGFKWISRVPHLLFGYEEAIGMCVDPQAVHDKDGISACVMIALVAATLKQQGRTLSDALHDIYAREGVYMTAPVTIRVDDLSIIGQTMDHVRTDPPRTLAGSPVQLIRDYAHGVEGFPPTDAVEWRTEANDRVIIRPSGTEPKVKCYLEVALPVNDPASVDTTIDTAAKRLDLFQDDVRAALQI